MPDQSQQSPRKALAKYVILILVGGLALVVAIAIFAYAATHIPEWSLLKLLIYVGIFACAVGALAFATYLLRGWRQA
jgi:hypothetical protein